MSQQINLLSPKTSVAASAVIALAACGLVLIAIATLWGIRQRDVSTARAAEAASAQALHEAQERLRVSTLQANGDLGGQITALQARAEAAQRLLAQVATMGSPDGYSRYFAVLAALGEEGLWLTNVEIRSGGKIVGISGRALREDAVMRYAQRLNGLFVTYGVQFNSLEMTPTLGPSRNGGTPVTAISFKLDS